MVGFCGIIGDPAADVEPLVAALPPAPDERRTDYRDGGIVVHRSAHAPFHEAQPATTGDGSLIWIFGEPYGLDRPDGYQPRTDFSVSDAEYCAHLYDEHGRGFVADLNGEFAGLIFDQRRAEAYLFTDRLGTTPIFVSETDRGVFFSSRIQSIGLHPAVTPGFDAEYLAEFFGVQKVFGTGTPLRGVRNVPPATIETIGRDGVVTDHETYWRPTYRTVDRSPADLADELVDTFRRVFDERVRDDLEYGVLLSGGSDSRLVLGTMTELGRTPTAFHMTNWMSREARTAERVALTAGVDFRLLRRGTDYHERLLESVPQYTNFVGAFDESIASGFADDLASVDVLLTGYLGDTMFGEYPLYVPPAARLIHPTFEWAPRSISEYVERYLDRYQTPATVPAFLRGPSVADVMKSNMGRQGEAVRHHGVTYPSLRELQLCEYYPITNQFASANTDSVRQITGHWSPFFDNRLIDLHLSVPTQDRIRYDPINHAIRQVAPTLAAIPHATTGVPLDRSLRTDPTFLLRTHVARARRRLARDRPPAPYLNHGPWMDESELIRSHDFVSEAIERNADLITSLPLIDADAVNECYRDHFRGADHWRALYALVTLLESPVAERIGSSHR